ncbi:GlyGly-CTERM sorting domain-containing protein [Cocleimonas sp. KMM 6892]|uniref:GlyGly-CTERM sorting domain-containing protein n=1 Tax=unclassified Cocleimonas TaxID=2639732 RepID=UPI002DBD23BD|nr:MULTISPECIES: GlyGly-CTERM sorting domain-containing protein [unclassified Cocleimonas]MEB8432017.1 GlyGly-CTERM sorting domain-containing protein [Cocleimonas sp. KMM 6892]MEC4714897.1 GlyGly-CTERM sorting domain-containing protein [Cocleimonas sp. KMM 6895]MEC4744289.1 GlyGly-CTERM sorting domain-containing protein [Cocleimonas sp. KMM 6896]
MLFYNKVIQIKICLLLLFIPFYGAIADQVINDDLILSGVSDGTAPAYDCSAGVTLPFDSTTNSFDTSSVGSVIPAGDPLIIATPTACTTVAGVFICEYTCSTPDASACIGSDCADDEVFNDDTLRLKENNLRIRMTDTAVATGLGQSWNIEANSSRNTAPSYFDIQVKSVTKDTTRLVTALDGVVPSYDCSVPVNIFSPPPDNLPPVTGTIPIGQPFITPVRDPATCVLSGGGTTCSFTCDPDVDFEVQSALTFGTANPANDLGNSIAIGSSSEFEVNTVSVGKASLLRRIANVANAIDATDILTLERLDEYSVVEDQIAAAALLKQKVDMMNTQLDTLTAQIDIIDLDDDDDGFSDLDEATCGSDPLNIADTPTDTDNDKLCDAGVDADDDNDTFSDVDEGTCGTDSLDNTSVPLDTDSDGMCDDGVDTDDDGDNVPDANDAFPLDKNESVDTDGDGTGNNADTDDDGDGVLDINDAFPLGPTESLDTDGDGISNLADEDDDNDGVADIDDAFPLDKNESVDTDGDGTGNNADLDDDNDNVLDVDDAFALDATESIDTDGDGTGNNADTDDDGDNVPDRNDAFALDASESVDTDGDGIGNNADTDDDNDGVSDDEDEFPLDPAKSSSDVSDSTDDETTKKGGSMSFLGLLLLGVIALLRRRYVELRHCS